MTELETRGLAETLVLKFAEALKKELEANRKNGDTLGVCIGIPLYEELEKLRTEYLSKTDPRITYNTNIFNLAVIKHILKK
jgi:hypothetical protein